MDKSTTHINNGSNVNSDPKDNASTGSRKEPSGDCKFKGCGTALVTPFADGEIDYDVYAATVRRQVDAGIHFLVPLGTTAETPCLDNDEKTRLLEVTRANAPGIPLLAGAGTNSLRGTVANMRLLSEADGYLVVVPYYNKPTQRGIYEYFKAVASETDHPIVMYNVPGRAGANMSAATALRLAEIPNIVGLKEASGNLSQAAAIISEAPEGFAVLSGNDDQTLDMMRFGGAGVISVASNIVPAEMVQMVEFAAAGNMRQAAAIFRRLVPLFDACFVESNPIPVKAAMSLLGLMRNELRLPLVPCEPSTLQLLLPLLPA